jgi:ribosome-associated protein
VGIGTQVQYLPSPVSDTPSWLAAVRAAESKKATGIAVLDLRGVASFADYFVIATGSNVRQNQTIADEIEKELMAVGERPSAAEGYRSGEWILLDYGDMIVHVMSPQSRAFYDLERLWRQAKAVEIPPPAA